MTQFSKEGVALAPGDGLVYDHVHMLCRIVLTGEDTGGSFTFIVLDGALEGFFRDSGVPLDQAFEGVLPVPGPLSPEEVGKLVELVTPYGVEIVGPPPFDPPS